MIIIFVGLCKGNCRDVIGETLQLQAVVKSHNGLKGTKVGVLEEISKIYQNLPGRASDEVLLL